jgi:hypothetical protein
VGGTPNRSTWADAIEAAVHANMAALNRKRRETC